MKIACIAASQIPSDTANSIQVMKACQALTQLGHGVVLLVPKSQSGGDVKATALAAHYGLQTSFEVQWLPAHPRWKRYDFALKSARTTAAIEADLFYVWPLQAAVAGLLRRKPVILEMHGPPEGRFGPQLFRLFLRLPGRKRLLPITRALEEVLKRSYPELRGMTSVQTLQVEGTTRQTARNSISLMVSPNGVDLERFKNLPNPTEARQYLALPEALTVSYSGHLYEGRGMGLLLELAQNFPQVQFLWVGGRPKDVEAWRGRLASAEITNVILTGFITNDRLPIYQAAAEILLMPYEKYIAGSSGGNSAEYCSPMKMFEYMACQRAIISSDLPVIREVLNPANAMLCPPEEVEAWVQALKLLLDQPEQRELMSHRAWQDAQAYSWLGRAQKALKEFC